MDLRIVYIDDEVEELGALQRAVHEHNDKGGEPHIILDVSYDPAMLRDVLRDDVDLVLADVYWKEINKNQLEPILDVVQIASESYGLSSEIPVIAFTARGPETLQECLKYRDRLFDIWAKGAASPHYIIWRLSQLASELTRERPDTLIQRLVRGMPRGARWHSHVLELSTVYRRGITENDQIHRAGGVVGDIASVLGTWESVAPLWSVMSRWEGLSRAVLSTARGHARHVINVFWLGYYLIHHESLSPWFGSAWVRLLERRRVTALAAIDKDSDDRRAIDQLQRVEAAQRLDPLECFSDSWFYAGLFHDAAGCVQKYSSVRYAADELLAEFKDVLGPMPVSEKVPPVAKLVESAEDLFSHYNVSVANCLQPLWDRSIREGCPDHGVVAAVHIRQAVRKSLQNYFAEEAALAIAAHNLIGGLGSDVGDLVSWEAEPLMCLLLLCDQVQAWDRERADATLQGPDGPDRAQLAGLTVTGATAPHMLSMIVDYIAPRHVSRNSELFERVKSVLGMTLKDKPSRALGRIVTPWPFGVRVECRLSGVPLSVPMRFDA